MAKLPAKNKFLNQALVRALISYNADCAE